MNYDFSSQEELYQHVLPALSCKQREFQKIGFSNILETDIWNYLVLKKWKKSNNLMLSDIVNDILQTDCFEIIKYLRIHISE